MSELFRTVDTPLRRRLCLKGQASISIVIQQVPGTPTKAEPKPPDVFLLKMIQITPRPGMRPQRTAMSTKTCATEEIMWLTLRQMADERLMVLGQIEPPDVEMFQR